MLVRMNDMKKFAIGLAMTCLAYGASASEALTPAEEGTDQPLMWEAVRGAESIPWSAATKKMINDLGPHLLLGTDDMKTFCPSYNSLSVPQKTHFWAYFISALTKYECYYNPAVRYVEPGMGTDPITKRPIASEGLLQLSYQDVLNHPYCNEFDWSIDSKLKDNDPKKTIFDPYKNLRCGIQILDRQVRLYNKIGTDTGGYWAVIIPKNKHSKISQIVGHLKAVKFCGH